MRIALKDVSASRFLFVLALAIYAVFGSPTPDVFGFTEISIFACLAFSFRPLLSGPNISGSILLAYGLTIPLLLSLLHGYPLLEIIRDIVPFLFLLMPVLYLYRQESDAGFLMMMITSVGLIFAVRSLSSFGVSIWYPDEWLGSPPDLLYLANSPEVLFSATAFLYLAVFGKNQNTGIRLVSLLLSAIPLLAMMTLMQRASLFYIAVLVVFVLAVLMWKKPKAGFAFLIALAGFAFLTSSFLQEIYGQMSFKTQMVGLNSRGAEWMAVFDQVSQSPIKFLFGLGWGANFEDPAVGGLRVSFTHSLISSLLLKTGVLGVGFFFAYGYGLLKAAWPNLTRKPLYLFALAGPLLIGLCLYASYKSLGYGLLLLLLSSLYNKETRTKSLEQPAQTVP